MRKQSWTLAAAGLLLLLGPALYGYSPNLLLGLEGGGIVYQDPEGPGDGQGTFPLASAYLLGSWRNPTSAGGYLGLTASARLLSWFDSPSILADAESLALEAGLPFAAGLVELAGSLDASLMGDGEDPAHLEPRWQAGLRLGKGDLQGTLAYRGSYLFQPDEVEDFLYQGLRLGLEWERSVRLGFSAGLEGGWQYWPEYPLYDGLGALTGAARQDVLAGLQLGLDGLAGFFLDWSLTGSAGLRWSTANRFLAGLGSLEEGSENSLYAGLAAAADWSPHRSVGLRLEGFLRGDWYPQRAALTAAGADTGELLRVLSLGLQARADWTPDDRLFLVLEGLAGRALANDPAEERWNVELKAGVEYSF